jgi:ABC-2 type transport system permease protein
VAFLTTVPAQVLLGEAAVPMLFAGLVLAVLFFAAARAFWLFALRFYTSASS